MKRSLPAKVVIAEPFAESGLAVLQRHDIQVVSVIGATREELLSALADADGLIVRSETRVDDELIRAGRRLAVIARAGVGVDAIDLPSATHAGIVVVNTPSANTVAACEQTFALMLAISRNTAAAVAAVRAGIWDRRALIGTELSGKTLGIVGLGRIGGAVASRARAFGMDLLATDPFVSDARAEAQGARLVPLEELLANADIVTLHVPLTAQTLGLIGASQLSLMKSHALLINCARGGVVDEPALLAALDDGAIRGAALDVVAEEPPPPEGTGARLHRHSRVVATPHLGGSTYESLERIAIELATDVVSVLGGGPAAGAVNAPTADGADAELLRPFVDLAFRIGVLYPQLASATALPTFRIALNGTIAELPSEPVVNAFLAGLLQGTTDRRVSIANARSVANELGVQLDVHGGEGVAGYAASLRIAGGSTVVAGTSTYGGLRIIDVDGYEVDAIPEGTLLVTKHRDVPGMVGKVGTILGDAEINISSMQVSRNSIGGDALMILSTDRAADAHTIERLRAIAGVRSVRAIRLAPAI